MKSGLLYGTFTGGKHSGRASESLQDHPKAHQLSSRAFCDCCIADMPPHDNAKHALLTSSLISTPEMVPAGQAQCTVLRILPLEEEFRAHTVL